MRRELFGVLLFLSAITLGGVLPAQTVLTIYKGNGDVARALSISDMQHLPQTEVVTSNEFVDGEKSFRGPLARDLLYECGSDLPDRVTLTAANDYQNSVPTSEFFQYDVIFALTMDGEYLSSRDKGPIWVIYPMSQHAELRDPVYNSHLVWQLIKVDCK